ncbi:hypothetical protein [Sphingobacterium sp. LRF_L2]|uniref:hypothetical protein n=1 Tax=Sphingobacterium sp. LRF_L2 TaxID=3369421 RepID=UPI003F6347A7
MTNIKDRVLAIAESKGISKTDFFKELGLSYANFKGIQKQSALNSDAIATILCSHKDVNPTWLIMGEGKMYQNDDSILSGSESSMTNALYKVIESQDKTIQSLEKQITLLDRELQQWRNSTAG